MFPFRRQRERRRRDDRLAKSNYASDRQDNLAAARRLWELSGIGGGSLVKGDLGGDERLELA
jgi:hypothetical protein